MATRFNTFGTTSGLATEQTTSQIKDKLNDSINVNIGGGDILVKTNITAIKDTPLAAAELPVTITNNPLPPTSITGTVDTNITNVLPLNTTVQNIVNTNVLNTSFDTNITNASLNTVITNTAPNNVPVSIENTASDIPVQVNNTTAIPTTITDATLPPTTITNTVSTNTTQLNSNTISTSSGLIDNGTQRITLATDQQYSLASAQPISQVKSAYPFMIHQSASAIDPADEKNEWRLADTSALTIGTRTTGLDYATVEAPTGPALFSIASTSANDTGIGPTFGIGARQVNITVYTASNSNVTTTFFNIILDGTNPVNIPTAFYRLQSIQISGFGSLNYNDGQIFLQQTVNGKRYPGTIAPKTNRWNSAHIYIPPFNTPTYLGTRLYNRLVFDYVNFTIDKSGGDPEEIALWVRPRSTLFSTIQVYNFYIDSAQKLSLPLYNASFSSVPGYDIFMTFVRDDGGGNFYLAWSLGAHIE